MTPIEMNIMPETLYEHGYALVRPVYFIGFMGAGKSTVCSYLSKILGLPALDTDAYIEAQAGKTIADLFTHEGEETLRDCETRCIQELARSAAPCLVSCGGGVVLRQENTFLLRDSGFVIFLHVTAEEAAVRIADTQSRPLFKDATAAPRLLAFRLPLYRAAADVCVDTTGKTVAKVAFDVKAVLLENEVLVKAE